MHDRVPRAHDGIELLVEAVLERCPLAVANGNRRALRADAKLRASDERCSRIARGDCKATSLQSDGLIARRTCAIQHTHVRSRVAEKRVVVQTIAGENAVGRQILGVDEQRRKRVGAAGQGRTTRAAIVASRLEASTVKPRTSMIALRERTEGSRFVWLYGELRSAILSGRLAPGSRVPSTRQLAEAYNVARGTVVSVFEQLLSEGYVTCTTGSGTYVADSLPDDWFRASIPRTRPVSSAASDVSLSARGRRLARHRWLLSTAAPRPFRAHHPEVDAQTLAIWKRLCGRVGAGDGDLAVTGNAFGYLPLRAVLAEHLGRVRGLPCEPEQVIILASTHQSIDLAARLLTDHGDEVLVEDPGYPGAWSMFEVNGLVLRALPVDADGADIGRAEMHAERARIAYVTPAHQFPLGVAMSVKRRLELLAWASRRDSWIVEDDYDGEYRFTSRPIAALAGLDEHERVLYTGTLNKVLFPALRLAYMVVPASLAEAFAAARATVDRCPPIAQQLVLCEFIREGHFDRHLRRMRTLYEERLHTFSELIDRDLSDELELAPTTTGLQTVCWLRNGRSDREVARAAWNNGVEVFPISRYRLEHPLRSGLHCGFGAFDRPQMLDGIRRLREVLHRVAPAPEQPTDGRPVRP